MWMDGPHNEIISFCNTYAHFAHFAAEFHVTLFLLKLGILKTHNFGNPKRRVGKLSTWVGAQTSPPSSLKRVRSVYGVGSLFCSTGKITSTTNKKTLGQKYIAHRYSDLGSADINAS